MVSLQLPDHWRPDFVISGNLVFPVRCTNCARMREQRRPDTEVEMKKAFSSSVLILFEITAATTTASAETPTLTYTSSGSCVASPEGFDSKLEPVNAGVAWRITFNALCNADANGNVTEVGQSVDSASFGVGPRMHMPAASAYKATYASTVSGPNEDGSFTLHVGTLSGSFTAGPNAGLSFTISAFELKEWRGGNGLGVYGSAGSPVIQNVAKSDGAKFQRICTMSMISTVPHR